MRKAGGAGISDLSPSNPSDGPARNFGQFAYPLVPFGFDWSDGTSPVSASQASAGITAPQAGQGFSFTVPADPTLRTLTVWTSSHYADGTLTATLSDGSAQPFSFTVHAVAGEFTNTGENVPEVFALTYSAAHAGQHLTVTWTEATSNGCLPACDDVVIYAAALSAGQGSTPTGVTSSLTSAGSVNMSGSNDPISSIPLSAFAPAQPGVTPAPINGLPINGLPINGLPDQRPARSTACRSTACRSTGRSTGCPSTGCRSTGSPSTACPINGLPINGLPINGLQIPGGWTAVLAGTALAGKPLQTITLQQVLALNPQPAAVRNLTLGNLLVADSALGQVTIGALALGKTPINGLGSRGQHRSRRSFRPGARVWPARANCSLAAIGNQSLFALSLAGAPINGLPINGLPDATACRSTACRSTASRSTGSTCLRRRSTGSRSTACRSTGSRSTGSPRSPSPPSWTARRPASTA